MYLGDSAAFTFTSSNQRRLDFCPNQWKGILWKDTLKLRDRKFKWVQLMRELNCVRAPPSRLEADSHFLSNSAERLTQNAVRESRGFFFVFCFFLNSSLPLLFTLLDPLLLHSARRLDGQKGVLKVEKEKANVTVEIVFRDALGISYKDNIRFSCQYPYWFYPRGNWAECAHLWKHPGLTSNLCYFTCNVSSSSCNPAGGGDGRSLTGSLIRHRENSYLAALERIVPKALPHMESFCQARGALGKGEIRAVLAFSPLPKPAVTVSVERQRKTSPSGFRHRQSSAFGTLRFLRVPFFLCSAVALRELQCAKQM